VLFRSGDPLLVIREMAAQVAAHGVKRIQGRVLVDTSMFPEGEREGGTNVVISPVAINDNLVDFIVSAGEKENAPVGLKIWPDTPYVTFINKMTTSPASSKVDIQPINDVANPDRSRTVTISGTFPLGGPPILYSYPVPQPGRFAQVVFVEALREKGIKVNLPTLGESADFGILAAGYTPENLLAEHVSPPLSEDVKVTLKVSQNLHASMTPFILGAVLGRSTKEIDQAGFNLEHDFLSKGGLDLAGASQGDGAGGARSAYFTPDFMVHYLAFMSRQKDFSVFERALPILGQDGTLAKIEVNSPAAGHVFAKTGTYGSYNALNKTDRKSVV
jgi:D-alanyl-D-alanine carboxypeptidase/D-alanyl-D-alanine-endopeptidase (penicillin-binding protein 4)